MNFDFINIVESTIMLAIFYLFFKIFLKKETFFRMNRLYLLFSLSFSVTIPFLNFNLNYFTNFSSDGDILNTITGVKQGYNELNAVIIYACTGKLTWTMIKDYISIIYILGVLISTVFFVFGLGKIAFMILHSGPKKYGKYWIVETPEAMVPFSLFKWIIINPEKHSSDDMKQIIAHERMHAFQLHSFDLVFVEVFVILFWFNPFIYWYRKSIREVHEYLADQAVVENGFDRIDYQQLLFNQVSGSRFIGLTSRFSYSLSKNRLKMLTMMKSKNISKIKIALAIPIAIVAIFLFTNPFEIAKANSNTNNEHQLVASKDTVKVEIDDVLGNIYFTCDVMPKFQDKDPNQFRYFIQENLKYPKEAQKKGIAGRVFVSFVVDKHGEVKKVEIERGVNSFLDKEAIRVIKLSPKWEPGIVDGKPVNVQFTFPIVFKLK